MMGVKMAKGRSELVAHLDEEFAVFTLAESERKDNVIDERLMYSFTETFLFPFYDDPQPIPSFHTEMWKLYCSDYDKVAIAAPRGCGKTTANTEAFALANILFQVADFILIGSNTEIQALGILESIKVHILFNETIKATWPQLKLVRNTMQEIVGTTDGTHYFKVCVRSSTQQFRGIRWSVKRPNLVMLDDFESPEDIMQAEIRQKTFAKFATDILLCGSSYCRYRVTGTILHEDALLEKLLQSRAWKSLRFAAHNEDFSKILFPGKFTKEKLQALMKTYEDQGQLDLYYREMLNSPVAIGDTLFKESQFQPMIYIDEDGKEVDCWQKPMRFYVTIDFAISEKQKADYTVFLVFGLCEEGFIYVVHVERFRASADSPFKIQETFFDLYDQFRPECFIAETEKIDRAIMPYIRLEQRKRNKYFQVLQIPSTKSKIQRCMGMVARMQSRSVYFNTEAHWFPAFKKELLQATPAGVKSAHDDQFDTFGMVGTHINRYLEGPTETELRQQEDHDYNAEIDELMEADRDGSDDGRDSITGY